MCLDKSGSPPESCVELVQHIMEKCPSLQFSGIMTIGALARSVQQTETNEDFEVSVVDSKLFYFVNMADCSQNCQVWVFLTSEKA